MAASSEKKPEEESKKVLPSCLPAEGLFWTPEEILIWLIKMIGPIKHKRSQDYWLFAHILDGFFPDIVEVRDSGVHGRGVFAKCDIPPRTVITCYPADVLLKKIPGPGNKCSVTPKTESADWANKNQQLMFRYMLQINSILSIIGNPEIAVPGYMGHMVNDGASCSGPEKEYTYLLASTASSNAMLSMIDDICPVIVSFKPIRAGTEVLVSYGVEHWRLGYK